MTFQIKVNREILLNNYKISLEIKVYNIIHPSAILYLHITIKNQVRNLYYVDLGMEVY